MFDPFVRRLFAMVVLALAAPALALAQDDTDQSEVEEDVVELATQVVTGSRLEQGDPSSRVFVITAEDIATRGFSSVEDVIRSIPQVFSSINSTTSMDFERAELNSVDQVSLGVVAVGISTANLRGFGSANTLVLLDGHRIAGTAGQEDYFANLRNIPAGAIERIEVNLDGGSTIYGSDAVAGTINIITRKDFTGAKFTVRNEQSSTNANQTQYSGYFSYGWENGGVSINLSRNDSTPHSAAKAGYDTKDWSARFDGDQAYNFNLSEYDGLPRNTDSVRLSASGRWGPFVWTLPAGNDGRNAYGRDFRKVTAADAIEVLDVHAGEGTRDESLTFNIEHTFADRLRLQGSYYRTEAESWAQLTRADVGVLPVPASNAFNNFGTTVYVQYDATTEVELGLLPTPERSGTSVADSIVAEMNFDFTNKLRLTTTWLTSESGSESYQNSFTRLTGGPLANPERHSELFWRLIRSSDPDEAINLFGDGTGQNATIAELFGPIFSASDESKTRQLEAYLSGKYLSLPGGEISFVAGGEQRTEETFDRSGDDRDFLGLERPYRKLDAYFAEVQAPLFSKANARAGFQSLVLTVAARRDRYSVAGSVEQDANGNPILTSTIFDSNVKSIGLRWALADSFAIRARRGEGFVAPSVIHLFGGEDYLDDFEAYDPLTGQWVAGASSVSGPNPGLKPQTSDNLSYGFEWRPQFAPGLSVKLDYSSIDYSNRIAYSWELENLLPSEVYGNLPELFERSGDNTLIRSISRPVNISRRKDKTWDLALAWPISTSNYGTFTPQLYYHYVEDLFDQYAADSPKASFLGQLLGIDKRKIQARLEWLKGRMTVSMFYEYRPGYLNNYYSSEQRDIPEMPVGSRYTVDLSGTYKFDNGILIRLGGRNIFDADFPFALNGEGKPYDASRVDVRGQVWFAELSYEFF